MRIYSFIVSFLLISCAPIKIKDIQMPDSDIQKFRGHVKELRVKKIKGSSIKDLEALPYNVITYWDKKGNLVKQKDQYGKDYFNETLLIYDDGFLIKSITKSNKVSPEFIIEHKYDKKGNEIEYIDYYDKKLNSRIVYQYDKKGNKIFIENFDGNGKLNFKEKIVIDYKNKNLINYSYNKLGELNESYSKSNFDRNGNRTKSELFMKKAEYNSCTIYEYDKRSNLLKWYSCINNKNNFTIEYKYYFDKIGNIIKQEKLENNILVNTVLIDIVYW